MLDNLGILTEAPVVNVQLVLDGIFVGAVFALVAYGLALVWGVMNVKNLAQGDFVMLGGYVAFALHRAGVHPALALPVAAAGLFGFGWLVYRLIIRRVVDRDLFTSLLATFGLAIVLAQVVNQIFGPEVQAVEAGLPVRVYLGGMVTVADVRLLSLALTGALALAVVLFMTRSRLGQAIRATAQDRRAAKVIGVDTDRVYAFTYALNAAICGAAGVLVSTIWVIQPFLGLTYSVRAFVIVTAAGLGNLPGVIGTGLALGIAEQFGGFVLGAEFQQAIVVGLLVLVLVARMLARRRHRQALA
jgi:branched-chain amino acid transport system permease protein